MSENIVNEYQDFVKETYKYNFDKFNPRTLPDGMRRMWRSTERG